MSDKLRLGKLIYGTQHRDAIHVAVAPVTATEKLKPGERVRFLAGSTQDVCKVKDDDGAIGIVDPFLLGNAHKGARFWLFLFPGTITSLRHEWSHHAFGDEASKEASRLWIEGFAAELDQTYNRLMEAAALWVETDDGKWGGEYTYDNSETYKDVHSSKWPVFWHHYEVMTGKKPTNVQSFFTCAC